MLISQNKSLFVVNLSDTDKGANKKTFLNFNIMKTIAEQFEQIEKMKIFEIEVINKNTCESEYLIFYISIEDDIMWAVGEFVAYIEIDENFSLDNHLDYLYNDVINEIIESDLYDIN